MKKNFAVKKKKQKKNKKNKFKFRQFFSKYYKKENNLNKYFDSIQKNQENYFENNLYNSFDDEKKNTIDCNSNELENNSDIDLSEQESSYIDFNKYKNTYKSDDLSPVKSEFNNYDIFELSNLSESTKDSF